MRQISITFDTQDNMWYWVLLEWNENTETWHNIMHGVSKNYNNACTDAYRCYFSNDIGNMEEGVD